MDNANNITGSGALTPFQILAAAIFTATSFTALAAYILVLVILFAYFRELKSNFYCVVISLSVADIAYLALIMFYVVPCTILKRRIWAPNDYGAGLLECLAYISQCVHLTFVALNRLAYAAASPSTTIKLDELFHNGYMVAFWIAVLWLLSAGIAMPIKLIGCDLIYDYEALNFMRDCRNRAMDLSTQIATVADAVISGLLPVLITVLHLITWFVVYAKGKQALTVGGTDTNESQRLAHRRQREKRILIQFTLISSALLLFYVSFWVIPEMLPGSAGAVVITLFGIVSSGINPFLYLKFNKLIEGKAKHIIFEKVLKRQSNAVADLHEIPPRAVDRSRRCSSVITISVRKQEPDVMNQFVRVD